MKTLIRSIATIFALSVSSAAYSDTLFECDFPDSPPRGWVSSKMAVVARENGEIQVVDGLLIALKQSPKRADYSRNTKNVLSARWKLVGIEDSKGQKAANMNYEFKLNKKKMTAIVSATPQGFENSFGQRGTCKVRKK